MPQSRVPAATLAIATLLLPSALAARRLAPLTQPGAVRPASTSRDGRLAEVVTRPVPLRTGIGGAHEPVTTRVARAQQFHDQGLASLHAYSWIDAARSFNEAVRIDPSLALAYVGLSYALGELGDATGARAASRRATDLAPTATPRERFRVELRARQLAAADAPGDAAAAGAYRAQLARIRTEFWSDVELLLIAGHAQETGAVGHGMHGGSASLLYYDRARALAPEYFAVDHYLAHAYENLGRPADALPNARRFATKAPAVPHAHHMYGHVLRQVDRMGEAIAEFQTADTLHRQFAAAEGVPVDLDWHYRHNLDLLATSYQYAGQMTKAAALLLQSFDLAASGHLGEDQDVNKRAWPIFLLARQRVPEALAAARQMQAHAAPLVRALGHIMASRALQASGALPDAAAEGNAALRQMRTIGPLGGTLVPDFELAQGEYLLRRGDTAAGGAMLRAGVSKLMADRRPDAWVATVFQLEAAVHAARDRGQLTLAADLARLLRQHAPFYAGTHYAIGLLAEQRGDADAARTAFAEAVARWRDADPDLREATDARRRLAAFGGAVTSRRP